MHSIESYSEAECRLLIRLARQCISEGVAGNEPVRPEGEAIPIGLEKPRACFVTLKIDGRLRGCIGNLEANSSLVDAVLRNSYLAAFRDHRFDPVAESELDQLSYEISVLTPMVPLPVESEQDLIGKLRPGVDGLLFEADGKRATFLPSVWEQLPDARLFLSHLRQKAGLPADYWGDGVKCWTYQAIKIGDPELDQG